MNRKTKIQELLNKLDELEGKDPQKAVARRLSSAPASAELGNTPTGESLRILAKSLQKVQDDPRPAQLLTQLQEAKDAQDSRSSELESSFAEKLDAITEELKQSEGRGASLTTEQVASIRMRLDELVLSHETETGALKTADSALAVEIQNVAQQLPGIIEKINSLPDLSGSVLEGSKLAQDAISRTESINTTFKDLEKRLTNRINQIQQHGGGNANRSFIVGGDANTLKYFTDVNLKAGAGTTISYSANQTTKYTDITITATGSGSGITRSVNVISIDTAAGAASSVDYVYVTSGTTTLTLPTAVGNLNLYTIKNVGSGVVSIATTGGQTIDGNSSPLQLPLQYTSVDLISNGVSWDIT